MQDIDYSLRLWKDIERKLIVNRLSLLSRDWYDFSDYQYVGFWSIYFIDFILFHRIFWIKDMVSFEKKNSLRYIFNKPYDFITLINEDFLETYENNINFSKKNIIWLDYQDTLTDDIIDNIEVMAREDLSNWSILTISLNCHFPIAWENVEKRQKEFILKFWNKWHIYLEDIPIPSSDGEKRPITEDDIIENWDIVGYYTTILEWAIKNAIWSKDDTDFLCIYKYSYKDWAKMFTIWFLFDKKEKIQQLKTNYELWSDLIEIKVPILTLLEKKQINSKLMEIKNKLDSWGVSEENLKKEINKILWFDLSLEDIKWYIKYHNEYPHFAEIII